MKGHQVMVLRSLGPTLACTTGQNTIGNTETIGEIQYCYNIPVCVYGLWVENEQKIHISLLFYKYDSCTLSKGMVVFHGAWVDKEAWI